jgi:hypothetical protein
VLMICWELVLICCMDRALESIHICCSPHMGQGPHALCWCCFVTKRASRCLYLDVHLDCNVARQQLCKKNTWRMMRMISRPVLQTRWCKHWLSISGDRAQWANRVLHNAEIIISLWIYLHFLLPCAIEDWPAFIWSVYYNPMLVLLHLQASGTQHFCLCNWWNSDLLFWDSRQPASCFGISMYLELVYLFRWQSVVQRRLTLIYALDHFTLVYVVWTELVVIYLMIEACQHFLI